MKRRHRRKNNSRGIVMAIFCVVFLFVGVAYASTNRTMTTNGSAKIAEMEAMTLSKYSLNLRVGEKDKIDALRGDKNISGQVIWSSSDGKVATIDSSGRISAISQGKTIITATYGGNHLECIVTVSDSGIETNPYITVTAQSDMSYGENYIWHCNLDITNISGMTLKTWSFDLVFPDGTVYSMQRYGVSAENQGFVMSGANVSGENLDGTITISGPITLPAGYRAENYVPIRIKNVNVTFETTVEAESIQLDPQSLTLLEGEVGTIEATVLPVNCDTEVQWSSADETIATVTNGIVRAKKEGTVIITASADSVQAICTVVVERANPLERLELNQTVLTMQKKDTFVLTARKVPEDAVGTIAWISSNPEIATVDSDGTVHAVSEGNAIITAVCGSVRASCNVVVEETAFEGKFACTIQRGNNVWEDGRSTYTTIQITNNTGYDLSSWSIELGVPAGMTADQAAWHTEYNGWKYVEGTIAGNVFSGENWENGVTIYIAAGYHLPSGYSFEDYFDKSLEVRPINVEIKE